MTELMHALTPNIIIVLCFVPLLIGCAISGWRSGEVKRW